jgi:hypothetical protein
MYKRRPAAARRPTRWHRACTSACTKRHDITTGDTTQEGFMTHGFTRITRLSLALLMLGVGPVWAGGYKRSSADTDVKSETNTGVSGGIGAGTQGSPAVGGALGTDTSVDGQVEPNIKQPEEPSASPRMDTEPSARDHSPRQGDQQAPRSEDNLNRPNVQSPRSTPSAPDMQSPRLDGNQNQPDTQSPRTKL